MGVSVFDGSFRLVQNINLFKMRFFLRNTLYCSKEIAFPKEKPEPKREKSKEWN